MDETRAVANPGKTNVYRWGVNFAGTPYESSTYHDRHAKLGLGDLYGRTGRIPGNEQTLGATLWSLPAPI